MSEIIKQVYKDVEIAYWENADNWHFELDGKELTTKSLRQAKDTIDNAPKPKRAVTRFKALMLSWGDLKEVTVGAFSKDWRGRPQFWVSDEGQRSKENATKLIKINEANAPIVAEIQALSRQITALQQEREAKTELLERVDIP